MKFHHRSPYSQALPHLQCILTVPLSMMEEAMGPNHWAKGQVGPPPPRLHCHSHYGQVGNLSHYALYEHAFPSLGLTGARTPEFQRQGSHMAVGGFCVVLSTCLAVLLGSPCRSVGPLSAQPQHGFSAPNTIGVSLVHHAQTNFGPIPCPQVATLKISPCDHIVACHLLQTSRCSFGPVNMLPSWQTSICLHILCE